jgi:pimeloyl-ACP methyl ester carboxylesterase
MSLPILLTALLTAAVSARVGLANASEWDAPVDVEFKAADGSAQNYVEMLPKDFKKDAIHHVMIAFHGHTSDRWQYIKNDRGETKGARDAALSHGFIFISPDYRGTTSWMGPKAEADVVQIITELRIRHRIGKVVLIGASMGGTSVLTFTALHPDLVDGVCSQNGVANHVEYAQTMYGISDAIAASFGGSKTEHPEEYKKRSAEFYPEKFSMPVSITVGGKDTVVPPASVLRLAQSIQKTNPNVKLINRENTGHETNYEDTVEAIEFVIKAMLKDSTSTWAGAGKYKKLADLAAQIKTGVGLAQVLKTPAAKKDSKDADEAAEAKMMYEALRGGAQESLEAALSYKDKDSKQMFALEWLDKLSAQLAGDEIGAKAKAAADQLRKDPKVIKEIDAEKTFKQIQSIEDGIRAVAGKKDTKDAAFRKSNAQNIAILVQGCQQLIQRYPGTTAAQKADSLLNEYK